MPVHVGEEGFAELVRAALTELPPEFQRLLQGLEVRVEDYPEDELMREWGLCPPNYPFGVYEGPSLLEADDLRDFPGVIVLFRRPLEEWCENEEELRDQIRRTVFHELAHRFGFAEEDMPEELWAGAGLRWTKEEQAEEARRYREQATHDLAAAQLLLERGLSDWALEAALTAGHRALAAFLLRAGEDLEVVASQTLPELFRRAAKREPRLAQAKDLVRLNRITTEMGDPGAEPPCERIRPSAAKAAVQAAAEVLHILGEESDGAV